MPVGLEALQRAARRLDRGFGAGRGQPDPDESDAGDSVAGDDTMGVDDDDPPIVWDSEEEEEEEEGDQDMEVDDDDDDDEEEEDLDDDGLNHVSDDELEGEGEDEDDPLLHMDFDDLRLLVLALRRQLKSAHQKARAAKPRKDFYRPKEGQTAQAQARAMRRREERAAKWYLSYFSKRNSCRPQIINRLALALSVEERAQLRGLGFLGQEWFLAARHVVKTLTDKLYTGENTLEIRLGDKVPSFQRSS